MALRTVEEIEDRLAYLQAQLEKLCSDTAPYTASGGATVITQEQQTELDKWACTCGYRQTIEDFVQMAETCGALEWS